ncbi:MAG TPA: ABC transporter permease [Gammaproteobacteria bacterium]|nr:ABC transporter permease [Gammaproteobacteria bacterium]
MGAIAYYTLLEALRNRLLWLVVGVLLAAFGLAEFLGAVAITETRQFQSGFMGALLRAFAVFVLSLFVISSIVREFNDKGLELVLSFPMPRSSYLLGKLIGFSGLALVVAASSGLCLLAYAPPFQAFLWALSLAMELFIVTAVSLLCLFTFTHVTVALSAVMAFYLLSRSMTAILLMGHFPVIASDSLAQDAIVAFLDALAFLLPELDRFTSSEWLIYHTAGWQDLLPLLAQTVIYVGLLCGAALFDLYRKNL